MSGPDRGVTLLELIVVLIVLTLLAAAIVPQFSGSYHDALLRATGRRLLDVIQLAHSQSISTGQAVRLQIDGEAHSYQLETRDALGSQHRFVPLEGVTGSAGTIDARIRVELRAEDDAGDTPVRATRDADCIAFHPDGTADASVLEMRDPEGFGLALRIHPSTSRVALRELEREARR